MFVGEGNVFHAALTAGGHPVATAAALVNIDIIEQEGLVERSAELGSYFLDLLRDVGRSRTLVGDVRGIGLLVGLELVSNRQTKAGFPEHLKVADRMTEKFRRRGLLLRMLGPQVLQMAPPLCVTRDEIDEIVAAVDSALSELESELASAA
jgi:adenosylmethionine-8-amino-7-oxononanoate aminotransferase